MELKSTLWSFSYFHEFTACLHFGTFSPEIRSGKTLEEARVATHREHLKLVVKFYLDVPPIDPSTARAHPVHGLVSTFDMDKLGKRSVDTTGKSALKLVKLPNLKVRLHFRRKLYAFYCQNNKWDNFSSCWWSNIVHVNISSSYFVLLFFFSCCISFDFTCYLGPKLFRELTRKPTGSFSFLACTLFSLYLIYLVL